jgi:hypothetical protein
MEEEELKLLRSIKKFDPFIKEQEKSFSLEHLLGLKSNTRSDSPTPKENGKTYCQVADRTDGTK